MDKKLFSARLSELRKRQGFNTQAQFARKYNEVYSHNTKDEEGGNKTDYRGIFGTLKNYENAAHEGDPGLQKVANMCDLLDCDIDYLAGRIDKRTHGIQYICETTGLSEKAVDNLIETKNGNCGFDIQRVNDLLETSSGQEFFKSMGRVFDSYKRIAGELTSIPAEIGAAASSKFSLLELNAPHKKLIDMRQEWLAVLYEFSLVCADFFDDERKNLTGKIDDLELKIKKERTRS